MKDALENNQSENGEQKWIAAIKKYTIGNSKKLNNALWNNEALDPELQEIDKGLELTFQQSKDVQRYAPHRNISHDNVSRVSLIFPQVASSPPGGNTFRNATRSPISHTSLGLDRAISSKIAREPSLPSKSRSTGFSPPTKSESSGTASSSSLSRSFTF